MDRIEEWGEVTHEIASVAAVLNSISANEDLRDTAPWICEAVYYMGERLKSISAEVLEMTTGA